MADNITLPASGIGSATPVVATRQLAGKHYQRVFTRGDDGPGNDSMGRLRTAHPTMLFGIQNEYPNPVLWEAQATGTGTYEIRTAEASLRFSTGGTLTGAAMTSQTRAYMRYPLGRSLLIRMGFVMSAPQTNGVVEFGYNDIDDGIFLQRSGTAVAFVFRTSVTGSPVDTTIPQASWNIDPLNGTGDSGITLDLTKAQILVIDVQHLGIGRVRIGFSMGGQIIYCHEILNQQDSTTASWSTGSLPLRLKVWNNGAAGGIVTIDPISVVVMVEGGHPPDEGDESHIRWSKNSGNTGIVLSETMKPVLSIRAASKYGGTANGTIENHGWILPTQTSVAVLANGHSYFEVVKNATLTNANWTAVDATSLADYDVSADGMSGGVVISSGYILGDDVGEMSDDNGWGVISRLVYGKLTSTADSLTISARTLTGAGTAYGVMSWAEDY